jgi:site-specific DNA-cytosine methylase
MWLAIKAQKANQLPVAEHAKRPLLRRTTPLDATPPVLRLSADSYKNGTFLQDFSKHVVNTAIKTAGRPSVKDALVLRVGSACSGSAMDAVSLDALGEQMQAEKIQVKFQSAFFVELDKNKREWCSGVHARLACDEDPPPCSFVDISSFVTTNERTPACTKHNKPCSLPTEIDLLICGFSCKDFARCNSNRKMRSGLDIVGSASSPGKSADTMHGVLGILGRSRAEMLILENVDELAQEHHSEALDLLLANLSAMGYEVKTLVLCCSEYGLPEVKKRLYIIGLLRPSRLFAVEEFAMYFDKVKALLKAFKLSGPSLAEVLLVDEDEAVKEELERRQKKEVPKGWDSSTMDTHREAWTKLGERWHSNTARASDVSSPWYATLPAREKDMIAFQQKYMEKKFKAKHFEPEGCARLAIGDVNQSVTQLATGLCAHDGRLLAPSVLPKSKMWISIDPSDALSSGRTIHRLLHGVDTLGIIGWPVNDLRFRKLVRERSSVFLNDLGGNAFASTVIIALVAAMVFAADFKLDLKSASSDELGAGKDDIARALSLHKRARK